MDDCITGSEHTRAIIDAEQIRIQQLGVHMGLRGQSTLQLHPRPGSRNDREFLLNELSHMGPPQWDMFFACFDLGHRLEKVRRDLSIRHNMGMILDTTKVLDGEHFALLTVKNRPIIERTPSLMEQCTMDRMRDNRISAKHGVSVAFDRYDDDVRVSISITSVLQARRDGKF